jgi:hypothetical protein
MCSDYLLQGQTISHVIVDLASLPSGVCPKFTSGFPGHSTIRLLRDFSDGIFQNGLEADLAQENERLENLNRKTQQSLM